MNQLYVKPSLTTDVYKIKSYKDGQLNVTYSEGEFNVGDYLRICNFDNISVDDKTCLHNQYIIRSIDKDILHIDCSDIIQGGLYIMNMTLQHSIHLLYN